MPAEDGIGRPDRARRNPIAPKRAQRSDRGRHLRGACAGRAPDPNPRRGAFHAAREPTTARVPFTYGRRSGSLLSWEPTHPIDELLNWEPVGGETVWAPYTPPMKLQHTEDGATLSVDMPGLGPADVALTFQAGVLSIRGKRDQRSYAFQVTLGDAFAPARIEADLDRGVLTVQAY